MKVKCDLRSKFSNLSNWKEEAWKKKNQGFNGIRTHDLRDTGAMLYQLSYEATHWEQGQFIWRNELNKLTLLPMCGFIAQLVEHRTGIAEVMGSNPVEALIFFFQASSFQLLKLENLLRRSHFTFTSETLKIVLNGIWTRVLDFLVPMC